MFVFDTDHISLLQHREEPATTRLANRMAEWPETAFLITIISFHEQVAGWNAALNRAARIEDVIHAYQMHNDLLDEYSKMQVLPFDAAAGELFAKLRPTVRIGTLDLRIASIVLSQGFTLLTRNTVDFARIPGLKFEDWTRVS